MIYASGGGNVLRSGKCSQSGCVVLRTDSKITTSISTVGGYVCKVIPIVSGEKKLVGLT